MRLQAHTVIALCLASLSLQIGCHNDQASIPNTYDYQVPLSSESPWPKFRRNAHQNAQSPIKPSTHSAGQLWQFKTSKGIFSSAVIGGDGTVYIGSADHYFYAINADGTVRWKFKTGEIIDSSALLDDQGRVIFGSGDGHLYALDAKTGQLLWQFQADDPSQNNAFINWFEGNVAMGPDGTLYVPNDNFFIYAIDRSNGHVKWRHTMYDQTWSLPAVDPKTGNLYIGNNYLLPFAKYNVIAIDADGETIWNRSTLGSVAASPLFTDNGFIVVGSFDGYVRAYAAETGEEIWQFATNDHIYASPAQLLNGDILQLSADGTAYALDAKTGELHWQFQTHEPLRSSPAVDGNGNIYFGSGEGKLFVLNADGSLRWSMQLITNARNDLNASPAIGHNAVVIAGENGAIFNIPLDYCLQAAGLDDTRCQLPTSPTEPTSISHAPSWYIIDSFGGTRSQAARPIAANQSIAFTLRQGHGHHELLALIDSDALGIDIEPQIDFDVKVSGNRQFLVIVPKSTFIADANHQITITLTGRYLKQPQRRGLRFSGGIDAGAFSQSFKIQIRHATTKPWPLWTINNTPTSQWELYRLALPMPTILPSYNQIGFDSLHFSLSILEGDGEHFVGWVVGATPTTSDTPSGIDPQSQAMFPVNMTYKDGLLTMHNREGLALEAMNAKMTFDHMRIAAHLDESGQSIDAANVLAVVICNDIPVYGSFLQMLGFCHPTSDELITYGAFLFRPKEAPIYKDKALITVEHEGSHITASFINSALQTDAHHFALVLVDATNDQAISVNYSQLLRTTSNNRGIIKQVQLEMPAHITLPEAYRVHVVVDGISVARKALARRDK